VSIVSRTPLEKAPAVLADRAAQLIAELGYQTRIGDHAFDFERDDEYLIGSSRIRRRQTAGTS
jgi:hypothetical protein